MALTWLTSKLVVPILAGTVGLVSGIGLQQRVLSKEAITIPPCPACNCPEPTVTVQPFDVEKIKHVKSFTYSPDFQGSISVAGVDSTSIKKYIDQAVMKAFEKHVTAIEATSSKRKRR